MPVIGQRAHGLPESVHEYGCAFMSLVYLCWREGRPDDAWDVNRIVEKYEDLVLNHRMKSDCTIQNWQKAADEIAPGLLRYDGYQTAGSVTSELAVAEWHYDERNWTHFVCARRGDSFHVEYDPWPDSQTCRYGHLVSVRGFSKR